MAVRRQVRRKVVFQTDMGLRTLLRRSVLFVDVPVLAIYTAITGGLRANFRYLRLLGVLVVPVFIPFIRLNSGNFGGDHCREDLNVDFKPIDMNNSKTINDPVEKEVAKALEAAGIDYLHERDNGRRIDFYLPEFDLLIECKHSYTERTDACLQKNRNIILIQGIDAARTFYKLLNGNIL